MPPTGTSEMNSGPGKHPVSGNSVWQSSTHTRSWADSVSVSEPKTHFADTSRGRLAYQVNGIGPVDVLVDFGLFFPIDLMWEEPSLRRFLDRLSSFSRHLWFDPRGRGASDPLPHDQDRFVESGADDILALVDHVGLQEVVLLGLNAAATILFAATHPERTKALVLVDTMAHLPQVGDSTRGPSARSLERWHSAQRHDWGTGAALDVLAPSLASDERVRRWLGRCERLLCTADEAYWRMRSTSQVDLRSVLASIRVPTLGVYREGSPMAEYVRQVAQGISGAKLIGLRGNDYLFFAGDTSPMLDAIEEFLTGRLPVHDNDRVLATVLFTDIVGSTETASRLGDQRWRDLLATHDALVRSELDRFRGRFVKSMGDGVLASFDGPGRAIRCACAIRDSVRTLGIDVRAGLHTGEIEAVGDDLAGVAVHIGARVSAKASAGEVLVSSTVKDLVAGSSIDFEDRGTHDLKGVPGSWRLYAVRG